MVVIGLSGKKSSGKSTLAKILVDKYGIVFTSIGDEIKKECSDITGIPVETFYDQNVKELYHETPFGLVSPRKLMQYWGEHKRKTEGQTYWLKKLKNTIANYVGGDFVVEDLRLKFEADFIKYQFYNSLLVRIEPYDGWDKWDDHITEVDLDDYERFDLTFKPEFGKLEEVADEIIRVIRIKFKF